MDYKILIGKDTKDYFDALIQHNYNPSAETEARLNKVSEAISIERYSRQIKAEMNFAFLYGRDTLDFVKSISKEHALAFKEPPYYLTWDIKSDENDDYWEVAFVKGIFRYQIQIGAGYGGTEILEDNISHERVLELINVTQS